MNRTDLGSIFDAGESGSHPPRPARRPARRAGVLVVHRGDAIEV